MPVDTQSDFVRAAHQRWPGYAVQGTGEWAVVCTVLRLVTLYDFAMLAKVEMQQPHSNWECAGHHRLARIKPAPLPQQIWQSRIWED
jgi:hypothetical protein